MTKESEVLFKQVTQTIVVIAAIVGVAWTAYVFGRDQTKAELKAEHVYIRVEIEQRFNALDKRLIPVEIQLSPFFQAFQARAGGKPSSSPAVGRELEAPLNSPTENEDSTETELPIFYFDSPKNGQSFRAGSVTTLRGTHRLPKDALVWIVLSDDFGNYYLQNPPVELFEHTWIGRNVHLGQGITEIHAVRVTRAGYEAFLKKVERREWAGFKPLPSGSEIIATINVRIP